MASKRKDDKKASVAAVAAPSDRGLSVTSQVFIDLDAVKEPPATGLFIKIICDFLELTWISEVLGTTEQSAWVDFKNPSDIKPVDENAGVIAVLAADTTDTMEEILVRFKTSVNKFPIFEVPVMGAEKLQLMDSTPGMHAILFGKINGEDVATPITFAYLDCSAFAMEGGSFSARSQTVDGFLLEITASIAKPIFGPELVLRQEPVIIELESLGAYPVFPGETVTDALDPVYVYGKLNFGSFSRSVFARPYTATGLVRESLTLYEELDLGENILDSIRQCGPDGGGFATVTINDDETTVGGNDKKLLATSASAKSSKVTFNKSLKATKKAISANPGARIDMGHFRVCVLPGLSDISRFKEELKAATFALQIHREDLHKRSFHKRNMDEYKALVEQESGKARDPKVSSWLLDSDKFLLGCIEKALSTASQVHNHGAVRFRLEQLLDSSSDLLKEFARRRQAEGAPHDDDDVAIHEDMRLEVRLTKPSKPPKVDRPSDFSLKAALKRAQKEELSKLDGTLAAIFEKTGLLDHHPEETNDKNARASSAAGADKKASERPPSAAKKDAAKKGAAGGGARPPSAKKDTKPGTAKTATAGGVASDTNAELLESIMKRPKKLKYELPPNARPRHEMFLECDTKVRMSVELRRKLEHPQEPPEVIPYSVKRFKEQMQYSEYLARRENPVLSLTTSASIRPEELFSATGTLGNGYTLQLHKEDSSQSSQAKPSDSDILSPSAALALVSASMSATRVLVDARQYVKKAYEEAVSRIEDWSDDLTKRLKASPFTRMVFAFKYDDDDTLLAINEAVNAVNRRTMANIQGTLRSYAYTAEELDASATGELDVISGFMMIDDDMRLIVIEGLAGPGLGMQSVYMDLPREKENDGSKKVLCNPEILFPERIYNTYGPDLKRIRLRDKLKKLSRRPELYNRKQVDEVCFNAVDSLMALRRAVDLRSTKELKMFPTTESLNMLELLYGEAVSRADIDGIEVEKLRVEALKEKQRAKKEAEAAEKASGPASTSTMGGPLTSLTLPDPGITTAGGIQQQQSESQSPSHSQSMYSKSVLPPKPGSNTSSRSMKIDRTQRIPMPDMSDCRNEAFDEFLRTRPAHRNNFIDENRELRRQGYESMLMNRAERQRQYHDTLVAVLGKEGAQGGKIYMYSQQALNFKTKAVTEMRERLSKIKNSTFTFSKDFVSQTLSLVDEEVDRKQTQDTEKQHWLTQKGFRYPYPKTNKELVTHSKRPTDTRIEDLQEPWQTDLVPPPGRKVSEGADPETLAKEKGYIVQNKSSTFFGTLGPPQFERDFELKLIGDREKLPRGVLTGGKSTDPDFFRSVHIGGEKQAKIIAEAIAQEKEEWKSKVVVDHTDFKVGGYSIRDVPIRSDRTRDILKDEPKALFLKKLRDRTNHHGQAIPFEAPPLAMFSTGPFVQNEGALQLMRKEDPMQFMTIKDPKPLTNTHGQPQDFTRYINRHANVPKVVSMVAKRKHPELNKNGFECSGPQWESPSTAGNGMTLPPI